MAHTTVTMNLISSREASVHSEHGRFVQSMRGAPMGVCKDVISLIKKQIKSKSVPPPVKLRALKLLHACMMTGNNEFLLFASKKVMQRFTVFARYKKNSQDENRGSDIFGNQSTSSTENMQASAEFLKSLLSFLKIWAQQYGQGPDGSPSAFLKAYKSLEAEGVRFPEGEQRGRRSSQPAPPKPQSEDDAGFLEDIRPRGNPSRPKAEPRSLAEPPRKAMKKDLEAIRSSLELMKEMLGAPDPDKETLDVLAATLGSHVAQLEMQIGSLANLPHQEAEIQTLLEANDSIRDSLSQYERFKSHGSSSTSLSSRPKLRPDPPKPAPPPKAESSASLLDLNFDIPKPIAQPVARNGGAAAFQTEAYPQQLSYAAGPNNPFLSVRPQAAQQWSDPNSGFPSLRQSSVFDQQSSLPSPKHIDPELASAKLEVAKLTEAARQHQTDIERLQKKYETRLAEAESRRASDDPRRTQEIRAMMDSLQTAVQQKDGEIAKLRGIVDELSFENRKLKEELGKVQNQGQKLPPPPTAEVFLTTSSNSSSNSPFNSQTGASPGVFIDSPPAARRSLEPHDSGVLTNSGEIKAVWFADRGKLLDCAAIQVGFKVMVQGSEARAVVYIGNKSPGDLDRLVTTIVNPPGGLEGFIDKEEEGMPVPERGKADRQLRFKATSYFTDMPKLAVRFFKDQREVRCMIALPVTVLRFLNSPKGDPAQVLHIWNTLEPSSSVTKFRAISAAVGSMALLAEALTMGDCFQVVTRREVAEIEPGALLACARKEAAILFLKIKVDPGVGGTLERRCNNPRLRECALSVVPSLLIDSP